MSKSSLTFQVLLHLGSYYFGFLCFAELLVLIYKFLVLPYPGANFAIEIVMLCALAVSEAIRVFTGWKGNLTEASNPIKISLLLFVPGVLGVVYFFLWQTYVLRIEMVMFIVQLVIQAAQLILTLLCLISFGII